MKAKKSSKLSKKSTEPVKQSTTTIFRPPGLLNSSSSTITQLLSPMRSGANIINEALAIREESKSDSGVNTFDNNQ